MEVDRDWGFFGNGGTSFGFWLNLLTKSFNDVWRCRAGFERLGVDFVALSGELLADDGDWKDRDV